MSLIYRTFWLGMTSALLLGAPSRAAAEPLPADTTRAPVSSAPAAPAYPSWYSYAYPYPYRSSFPPPAPPSVKYWYGWQTLTSFGVSTTLLVTSFAVSAAPLVITLPLSIGGFVLGGPIVHWANGNTAKGFISLGMTLGGSAVGTAIAAAAICAGGCSGDSGGLAFFSGGAIGGGVAVLVSTILDVSLLAYGQRQAPLDQAAARQQRPIALLPTLDIRRDRTTVGLMGTF
jgi:hypothetical protein